MIVIISTCNRKPEYIHQTIASLLLADKVERICLVVDGNSDYLKHYNNPLIVKYLQSESDLEFLKSKPDNSQIKGTYNYCRCLKLASQLSGDIVILEDDVVVQTNWIEEFYHIKDEIKDENPYLLSLRAKKHYSAPLLKTIGNYTEQIVQVKIDNNVYFFDGCQACHFSKNFPFDELIQFLLSRIGNPYDLEVSRFFIYKQFNGYYGINGLFKHLGENTAIGTDADKLETY